MNNKEYIIADKLSKKIAKKAISKYYHNDDEFFYLLCDVGGSLLKHLSIELIDYLKRKFMIGKYSNNLKLKLQVYKKMTVLYNNTVILNDLIESKNYDKKIYYLYIKNCKQLNNMCYEFNDVLPSLNYLNYTHALYNYECIKKYMLSFSGRNGIIVK